MMMGLVFDVVILLLMAVSVLLIYSLLMITVEEKTFDSGIMRLIGLSKTGYAASILVQASFFVFPSIICAFATLVPVLYFFYQRKIVQQHQIKPLPGSEACLIALFIGIFIPMISCAIPIRTAVS